MAIQDIHNVYLRRTAVIAFIPIAALVMILTLLVAATLSALSAFIGLIWTSFTGNDAVVSTVISSARSAWKGKHG